MTKAWVGLGSFLAATASLHLSRGESVLVLAFLPFLLAEKTLGRALLRTCLPIWLSETLGANSTTSPVLAALRAFWTLWTLHGAQYQQCGFFSCDFWIHSTVQHLQTTVMERISPCQDSKSCNERLRDQLSLVSGFSNRRFVFSVVSGCFVDRVSPSLPLRPKLAQTRGLEGSELAFRRLKSACKVRAKSFGP